MDLRVLALAALVSMTGCLNGWTLLSAQTSYAAAKDGLFPAPLARKRRGVPTVGVGVLVAAGEGVSPGAVVAVGLGCGAVVAVGVGVGSSEPHALNPVPCRCIASECMAWRWGPVPYRGFRVYTGSDAPDRADEPERPKLYSTKWLTMPVTGSRFFSTEELNTEGPMADDTGDRLSRVFAALADPTRRDMVARLAVGDATVNELAAPYDVSVQAVSKHLKVLEEAGLVSRGQGVQRRPVRVEAEVFDLMTRWIERYRQQAEERYRRLDDVLARMDADGNNLTEPEQSPQEGTAS